MDTTTTASKATGKRPWVSGPEELLQHGLKLLTEDSDLNRRLALIAIDNAVELTIKTYLSLPRRVTGVGLSRKGFEAIGDSFPELLDALETHAGDRIDGLDLADIEWYHRLRNQLYHQGSGLTVERVKVEVYATIAQLLFKNLFGVELETPHTPDTDRIGLFLVAWVEIERLLQQAAWDGRSSRLSFPLGPSAKLPAPLANDRAALDEINTLRHLRHSVVHEGRVPTAEKVRDAQRWARLLRESEQNPSNSPKRDTMDQEPNEKTQGKSGEEVKYSGQYVALCCRAVKRFSQGDKFPACAKDGETTWGWIPPIGLADA